jgi:protein TonB
MTSEADLTPQGILPIITFVLWCGCLAVGAIGLWLPYPGLVVMPDVSPVRTRLVDVRIESAPPPPPPAPREDAPKVGGSQELSAAVAAPPPMEKLAVPAEPPMAVASPSATIAFAVPVEGLVQVVDAKAAEYRGAFMDAPRAAGGSTAAHGPANSAAAAVPAITHLTLGEGEGNQPPPEYPRESQLAGQQGSVGLQFTVNENGRVISVSTTAPSRWPLLNAAAIRAVRNHWQFSSGAVRTYDVTIEFQLQP